MDTIDINKIKVRDPRSLILLLADLQKKSITDSTIRLPRLTVYLSTGASLSAFILTVDSEIVVFSEGTPENRATSLSFIPLSLIQAITIHEVESVAKYLTE